VRQRRARSEERAARAQELPVQQRRAQSEERVVAAQSYDLEGSDWKDVFEPHHLSEWETKVVERNCPPEKLEGLRS
jgi:hypothetical protein